LVRDCIRRKTTAIVLSRGERQAKLFIEESVAPHVRSIGIVNQLVEGSLPGTSIFKEEIQFSNGSKIIALPANPATARSYEGDVVLDEFAFHQDARKIYEAIEPSITRGYKLAIISTPNGQQGAYYDLAKEAGLVDGNPTSNRWSAHRTSIHEAVQQGCLDRNGQPLNIAEIRAGCLDEEMWLQEYCCEFLSILSQWISPELFDANASPEVHVGAPSDYETGLFAGWDVARNRDLSVIWFLKKVGDITFTRGVIEWRNVPTPEQTRQAKALMRQCQRMCIDKGSMGLAIYEQLYEWFGSMVEGITFTLANKESLAVNAKRRMEQMKARIPDTDAIRNSFRSVKKTVTATGQARFDAEHDLQYGHADHWWAYCLAESAAGTEVTLGLVEYLKEKMAEQKHEARGATPNSDKSRCPNCGAICVVKLGGQWHCNQCAHTWGAPQRLPWGFDRRDYFR
jgi:phage FluMu gp28-like protein